MKLLQVNATLLNRASSNNSCNKFTIRISEITLLSRFQVYYIIKSARCQNEPIRLYNISKSSVRWLSATMRTILSHNCVPVYFR